MDLLVYTVKGVFPLIRKGVFPLIRKCALFSRVLCPFACQWAMCENSSCWAFLPALGTVGLFFYFNDAEHLCVCLLDTLCIYFGEMSAQRSVHFSNWVFLLNFKILFYFIVTSPFLDMCITDPFPQHVDCLFIILMGAFENSGFLILVNSSLSFFFSFYSSHLLCPSRKYLPIPKLQKFFKLKFLEILLF